MSKAREEEELEEFRRQQSETQGNAPRRSNMRDVPAVVRTLERAEQGSIQRIEELEREVARLQALLAERDDAQRNVDAAQARGADSVEIDALKRKLAEADAQLLRMAKPINPKDIGPSSFMDRLEIGFDDAEFHDLRRDIAKHGVQSPILVRPSHAIGKTRYELVFGHRRWRACLLEGIDVPAIIRDMDDAELVRQMDRENRFRKDLSDWETALKFKRWHDAKLFASYELIAKEQGTTKQRVAQYLAMLNLPKYIIQAFGDPRVIREGYARQLLKLIETDEPRIKRVAQEVCTRERRPAADVVYQMLTTAEGAAVTQAAKKKTTKHTDVVRYKGQRKVFTVVTKESGTRTVTFNSKLPPGVIDRFVEKIKDLLNDPIIQKGLE